MTLALCIALSLVTGLVVAVAGVVMYFDWKADR